LATFISTGLQPSLIGYNSSAQSTIDQDETTAEHSEQKDKEELTTKNDMIDPSSVMAEFLDLRVQLEELLQSHDALSIVKKCSYLLVNDTHNFPLFPTDFAVKLVIKDTHNIPLFPSDYAKKLQEIKRIPELIQKLSPFITWDNHSILRTIAETSDVPGTTLLFNQFGDRIDSSQPLTIFPIPASSHHMIPYDNSTYTVLAIKLDFELYNPTIQNVIDALDQCKLSPHCLQLLAVAKTNFTILYWMIPKVIYTFIYLKLLENFKLFHQNSILQMAVYPESVVFTDSILTMGPLSFFYQFDKSVSL